MDTQEEPLSSQDSFFNENDVYHSLKEEEPQEDLLYALLVNHKRTKHIEIYESKRIYGFGREKPDDEKIKFHVFQAEDFKKSQDFSRISKQHFFLTFMERVTTAKQELCAAPIIIQNVGRNGLYVNNQKLGIGDKQILNDGDMIKLSLTCELFQFSYRLTIPRIFPKGCELYNKYFFAGVIGRGGCGEVYLCYNIEKEKFEAAKDGLKQEVKGEFNKYALKYIGRNFDEMTRQQGNEKYKERIIREVKIMQELRNIHVLKLISYYQTDNSLLILVPYMSGGDLLHRILKSEKKRLSEFESKFFFLQLLLGLQYMHGKGIAHRDIKCDNILLNHEGEWPLLKISDFGLSKEMKCEQNTVCGTTQYCAPEVLQHKPYSSKVDVWSSGVVLYAMLSGTLPFNDNAKGLSGAQRILKGAYEFSSVFNESSDDAKLMIKLMIQVDVDKRWDVKSLLRHSWIRDSSVNFRLGKIYEENSWEEEEEEEEEVLMKEIKDITIDEDEDDEPLPQQAKRPRLG